ncbi:MAG: energy transducer TonB [Paludibacter sp.]|nr:energy transducer TonB [Paludibacter sp.]
MKRILFLVLIGLMAISCLIQAQDKMTTGNSAESSNVIIDPGAGGDSLRLIDRIIEQMPQFPGGESALLSFIEKNLTKPPVAQHDNGVPGKVICRFVVEKDGSISNITVIRSLDPACDKEAVRVLKLLPKFIPGKQDGKAVRVYYTLPVIFKFGK